MSARIPSQPSQLTLGELARGGGSAQHRSLQRLFAGQVPPQLAISDGAHRGMLRGQIAALVEGLHLTQKTLFHHRAQTDLNASMKCIASRRANDELQPLGIGKRCRGFGGQRGPGAARQRVHFERALNPLRIVRPDACSRDRVDVLELLMQRGPTRLPGARREGRAERPGSRS